MILFIDYETFYDQKNGYSLKKMGTTEYLNDPRFKVHGAHVAIDEGKSQWVTAKRLSDFFGDMRQHITHMCAFNGRFDHAITSQFYMPEEKFLLDPMSMAQGVLSTQYPDLGMSLDALLKFAFPNNPERWKVHGVLETTDGVRDLSPQMEANLAQYAGVDNDGARWLFKWLLGHDYPWVTALEDIHLTLAMAVYPQLRMDTLRAAAIHRAELRDKDEAAAKINVSREQLRSANMFADLLRQAGCEPPVKLNSKNELVYAFAAKDEDFKALADHDNPMVRALYEARVGEKSNQALSRSARFARLPENLPIPTRYAAAHTGRHGGEEFNMQNLKRGHALRGCVRSRQGHRVLVRDLSQIELRMNAWWCGENWLLELLRNGGDPYCVLALKIYGRPITRADDAERFVGKQGELSCGYQSGWAKALASLRGNGVDADEKLAKAVVYGYRDSHPAIVGMWKTLQETALPVIAGFGQPFEHKGVRFEHGYVRLPSGRRLWYPELRVNEDGDWVFRVNPRRNKGGKWKKIFGGALLENIIQALSYDVFMMHARMAWQKGYRMAMAVHDEMGFSVPEEIVEAVNELIARVQQVPAPWCPDIPLKGEGGWGDTYLEAK